MFSANNNSRNAAIFKLDLTRPEPLQFELIRFLVQAYPRNMVVNEGLHQIQRKPQLFLRKSVSYTVDLQQGFIQCVSGGDVTLAVIKEVLLSNTIFSKYLLEGLLEPIEKGYAFKSFNTMVGLVVHDQIDPVAMSVNQSQLLGSILLSLHETNKATYLPAGVSSHFMLFENQHPVMVTLNLKYPIVARPRGKYAHQLRFEVLGSPRGEGVFGSITTVLTTLVPQSDGSLLAVNRGRVIKQSKAGGLVVNNTMLYDLAYEYKIASMTPHMHVKPAVVSEEGQQQISWMVEKCINGMDLETFFAPHGGLKKLSLDQRLRLVLEVVRSFAYQVLMQELIHRDIKPPNAIVQFDGLDFPRVSYVDFGLSRRASDVAGHSVSGTPAYIPPEVWDGQYGSFAADVYALGVVIGGIFGAQVWDSHRHFNTAAPRYFDRMFNGVKDITEDQKQRIKAILEDMCAGDFTKRPSLSAVAKDFDDFRFENSLRNVPQNNHEKLRRVHAAAREFSIKLDAYCNKHAGSWDDTYIRKEFLREMNQFPDQPVFVREFVTVLGVYALRQFECQKDVIAKINALTTGYMLVREQLEAELAALQQLRGSIQSRACSDGYAAYLSQLYQDGAARYLYTPSRMDDLEELSLKCRHVSQKIESERRYMDDVPKGAVPGEGRRHVLLDDRLPSLMRGLFLPPSDVLVDSRTAGLAGSPLETRASHARWGERKT